MSGSESTCFRPSWVSVLMIASLMRPSINSSFAFDSSVAWYANVFTFSKSNA